MPNCRKPTVRLTVPHYCPKPTVRLTVPHYCPKAMVLWLGLFACLPLVGCGRGSDGAGPPTAAVSESVPDAAPAPKAPADSPAAGERLSDRRHPVVQIETSQGNVIVRLDGEKAPLTVGQFPLLRSHSFYDGTIIHQVYKGQGIVGGGYDANGSVKRARPFAMKPKTG